MKCDLCKKPAVVHEVTVKSGIKKEVHLCEDHAKEAGIALPGQQPINQLLTQFVVSQTGKSGKAIKKMCPGCGLSFSQFKQTGKIGCPECYQAFEAELAPLIERAHSGGSHHLGKSPKRAGKSVDRQILIQRLARELDQAVACEHYERAAELRDQLNTLDINGPRHTEESAEDELASGAP